MVRGTNHKLVTGCWVPKAHRCTRATEAILSGPSQQKIYHSTSHTKFVMPFQMQVQEESNHSVPAHHYKRIKATVPPTILPASLHLHISSSISVIFPLCSTTIGGLNSEFKPSLGPPLRTASHVHVPLAINTGWQVKSWDNVIEGMCPNTCCITLYFLWGYIVADHTQVSL